MLLTKFVEKKYTPYVNCFNIVHYVVWVDTLYMETRNKETGWFEWIIMYVSMLYKVFLVVTNHVIWKYPLVWVFVIY